MLYNAKVDREMLQQGAKAKVNRVNTLRMYAFTVPCGRISPNGEFRSLSLKV